MEKITLTLPGKVTIEGPKTMGGGTLEQRFPNIGSLITQLLPYIFVIAGLALFIFLIIGGFSLLA